MEPCLNGTLVRADRTNKDVSGDDGAARRCEISCLLFVYCRQHFREHLDKLFAKGIGLLGDALAEAFTILSDVSPSLRTPPGGASRHQGNLHFTRSVCFG